MPAFLHKCLFAEDGVEHRVNVDVDEIVKIFFVLAGNGVAGLVGEGEGIDEGCE